jgi:hypothetical protein
MGCVGVCYDAEAETEPCCLEEKFNPPCLLQGSGLVTELGLESTINNTRYCTILADLVSQKLYSLKYIILFI